MKIDINEALGQLAQAFNTTVEALYPLLIKQAYITGALDITIGLITLLVAIIIPFILWKYWDAIEYNDMEVPVQLMGFLFYTVAALVIPLCLYSGIIALASPEYWALKEVLTAIGGSK